MAQQYNVTIYAISTNGLGLNLSDSARGDRTLEVLAGETGGKAYFPKTVKKLPGYFNAIGDELRSQYTLAYRSTNPNRDGAFRKIRIDVKEGKYAVRHRSGYYARGKERPDAKASESVVGNIP
jgi:VWFA-related protein